MPISEPSSGASVSPPFHCRGIANEPVSALMATLSGPSTAGGTPTPQPGPEFDFLFDGKLTAGAYTLTVDGGPTPDEITVNVPPSNQA